MFSHHPAGFSEPLLKGQSGNAIPAPLEVQIPTGDGLTLARKR